MRTYLKIIFSILLFSFLTPFLVGAIKIGPIIEAKSIEEIINVIVNFIFWTALALVPIMIILAAFYFLTSGGNPEKINTAKRIIFWTLIGLLIVLLAKGIPSIIRQILGGGPGPGPGPSCPNGICDVAGGECSTCPADCTVAACCGNGICNSLVGENSTNCPGDCPATCASGAGGSCMRPATCFGIPPVGSHACYLNPFECTAPDGCCCVLIPVTCADIGYHCCTPDGCRSLHRNDLDPTCCSGEFCCQLGCCPDLNLGETCPNTCGDLCFCPSNGHYFPPGAICQ